MKREVTLHGVIIDASPEELWESETKIAQNHLKDNIVQGVHVTDVYSAHSTTGDVGLLRSDSSTRYIYDVECSAMDAIPGERFTLTFRTEPSGIFARAQVGLATVSVERSWLPRGCLPDDGVLTVEVWGKRTEHRLHFIAIPVSNP